MRIRLTRHHELTLNETPKTSDHVHLFLNAHKFRVLPGAAHLIVDESIIDFSSKVFWDEKAAGSDESGGVHRKAESQHGR